jgi:hypothetical protein
MSVIATPGGADSNAFCDIATADNYHSERLFNQDWKDASDDDKEASLIRASFLLNEMDWAGSLDASSSQALRFPRDGVYDQDGRELTGIPKFLVAATCDLALELIKSESVAPENPLTRLKAGTIELEFNGSTKASGSIPSYIMAYVARYLISSANNVGIVRS